MRRFQKEQAEDFVELLGQAHDEIKKELERKNYPAAMSLLGDCQEGAISLGNLIEKTESDSEKIVREIEQYCELVYRIHEEILEINEEAGYKEEDSGQLGGRERARETLEQGASVNVGKISRLLRQSFFTFKNSIHGIQTRLEVVFLPYKASMWDSMESLWMAADSNDHIDAYVVPIPYYDKMRDESFGEMHYEGGEYPKTVPVVWYKDYDFEKRRPDMAIIHNPYDDANYVTSVTPFFYSDNLKRYVGQLIYIPYFILSEIRPDERQKIEEMRHFCLLPGVVNADQVIVQSEDMRQVYINVLSEAFGEKSRAYWEKRVLGLGTPKLDKVLGISKEDLEIPEAWMNMIAKPDGSRKKIIFYNISIGALLAHDEEWVDKVREVLGTFRRKRDEIVLLWRPHPLVENTIKTMRPHMLQKYIEVRNRYIEEGWGIYDDTPDVDRAVVLSDAYYGDGGSVMNMYMQTGKPILIADYGNSAL